MRKEMKEEKKMVDEGMLNLKHQYPEMYNKLMEVLSDEKIMMEWAELQLNLDHQVREK